MLFTPLIKQYIFKAIGLFVVLFMFSFPYHQAYLPSVPLLITPFFEGLVQWSAHHIFAIQSPYTVQLLSDSTGLYIHVFNLFIISLLGAIALAVLGKRWNMKKIQYWFHTAVAYYLALQLFIYGLNKIFKAQFYLPEPNTLYATVGETHLDLLFWSTMGASYPYTLFSGIVEVLPACLLLFKRTRLLGAVIAFGVMINVVFINFSFDISVKVYSLFLLLLSIILIQPYFKKLIQLFIYQRKESLALWKPGLSNVKNKNIYIIAKASILVLILFEVLVPYYRSNNYNDDLAERPPLHGAYATTAMVKANDTLMSLLTEKQFIKRVFVHRKGYFIFQNMDGGMLDYKLGYGENNTLLLTNYYTNTNSVLEYKEVKDSVFIFKGIVEGAPISLTVKQLNLSQLPLLQKEFHWTIDGY